MLTCLPPTTGHMQLVEFAVNFDGRAVVLVNTGPDEPLPHARADAVTAYCAEHFGDRVRVVHHHREMEQDSSAEGYRYLWQGILWGLGVTENDYIVTSEDYGKWCAEVTGSTWIPYDLKREINTARGTTIRQVPDIHWDEIIPQFRRHLQTRVTIFGAESTGKTTLARKLEHYTNYRTRLLPEYARPYLENVSTFITTTAMTHIWKGQKALQLNEWNDYPLVIQDTDLFSTFGYWINAPRPGGWPPQQLREDARDLMSDLYIITPSAIPFEADPLRYGGDHREIETGVWIGMAENWELPYRVLGDDPEGWLDEAERLIESRVQANLGRMAYDRPGQ